MAERKTLGKRLFWAAMIFGAVATSPWPGSDAGLGARERYVTICRPATRCAPGSGPARFCRKVNHCYSMETQRRVPVEVRKCARGTPPPAGRRCRFVTRYKYIRVKLRRCETRTVCGQRRRPSGGACQVETSCRRVLVRVGPGD